MLKFLAIFFPSVRKIIKIKAAQEKLISALEENENIKYVTIEPFNRGNFETVQRVASLWTDSNTLKYLIHSVRMELVEEIEEGGNAVELQNQLVGLKKLTKVFEGYVKKYEQIQIQQPEGQA